MITGGPGSSTNIPYSLDSLEDMDELNVRDEHGDKKIENPKTGKKIKFSSALKAPKGTKVYNKARKMYNRLKEK